MSRKSTLKRGLRKLSDVVACKHCLLIFRRYWRYSHGTTWAELCDDLTVVDVPGDHFSLLRQDAPDMEPMVGGLTWQGGRFSRVPLGFV
jgi:hypothetical protein